MIGSLCVTVLVSLRLTELQSRRSAAIRHPEFCERCAEPGARAVIAAAGVAAAFGKRAPAAENHPSEAPALPLQVGEDVAV